MQVPNHTFDRITDLAKRYSLYSLFKQYYQGEWELARKVAATIQQYVPVNDNLSFQQDHQLDEAALFDYNRLFVGPGKLLASPYESAYRNAQGLVMQEETIAVRQFYLQAGIEVSNKNAIPDDHLGLEFEFICYLLSREGERLQADDSSTANHYAALYQEFCQQHILSWVYQHCDDILTHGRTWLCRDTAIALVRFLQREEANFLSKEEFV
ncbi:MULTISPECIES: TorD/DmsD family molecular chaperone [Pelosinus]|uniref:TorD/DmsD family molecular chaperone n=1 Tax=Pelosinus TaxID=365348 RepID=UPI001ED97575|nr:MULTISPECIES: molecular chaperone TorD family protein [Pelosinus]